MTQRQRKHRGVWVPLGVIVSAFLCAACGSPSAQEIQEEFDAYVAERNHCSAVSECTLVYPGCPLGCAVGVRTESAAEVQAKAEELIDDYESGGQSCAADCIPMTVDCLGGRCQAVAQQP